MSNKEPQTTTCSCPTPPGGMICGQFREKTFICDKCNAPVMPKSEPSEIALPKGGEKFTCDAGWGKQSTFDNTTLQAGTITTSAALNRYAKQKSEQVARQIFADGYFIANAAQRLEHVSLIVALALKDAYWRGQDEATI